MARKPDKEEDWFSPIAEIMVRQGCSFREAAEQIGKILIPEEARGYLNKKAFQAVLWQARWKYFEDLGSNPNRTKAVLLGQMVHGVQKLLDDGDFDKAVDAAAKLAKVEYGGADTQVNVLGNLNQDDIERLRAKIQKLKDISIPANIDAQPKN